MSSKKDVSVKEEVKLVIKTAKSFVAVIHNDDTTPFDLVIAVLVKIFDKSVEEASYLASQAHTQGRAVIMRSSLEYLESLVDQSKKVAVAYGYPEFTITIEEE